MQPLADARTAHAAALDAEVRRLRPGQPTSTTPAPPPPVEGAVPLARVRAAARASADTAAAVALDLPVDRVGLVASVAACCAGLRDGARVSRSALDRGSLDALQGALATEHAALWCYSLAVAFLPADQLDQARRDEVAHRALRASVERMLSDGGGAGGVRPAGLRAAAAGDRRAERGGDGGRGRR